MISGRNRILGLPGIQSSPIASIVLASLVNIRPPLASYGGAFGWRPTLPTEDPNYAKGCASKCKIIYSVRNPKTVENEGVKNNISTPRNSQPPSVAYLFVAVGDETVSYFLFISKQTPKPEVYREYEQAIEKDDICSRSWSWVASTLIVIDAVILHFIPSLVTGLVAAYFLVSFIAHHTRIPEEPWKRIVLLWRVERIFCILWRIKTNTSFAFRNEKRDFSVHQISEVLSL